jgi:tetrahydromethanopterin S-methyltransferase subunit G
MEDKPLQNPLKVAAEWVADALVNKILEPLEAINDRLDTVDRRLDTVDSRLDAIDKRIDTLHAQDAAALEADLSVMDDRICYLITICQKRGYTTAEERRRITRMHDAYRARGGNHGEEIEYAKFLKLPSEEEYKRTKGETV